MKSPVRVAVTGAAGQIGYQILFHLASGAMLGPDQPVILQLLEITPAMAAVEGVMMELRDCAFPLLVEVSASDDACVAFKDVDVAILVGSRPRGPGMERKDLLQANGAIFTAQGKALNEYAKRDCKVLVVGNPANTNALIAMHNAPNIPDENFHAMTRLDHNRGISLLAEKTKMPADLFRKFIIWGNHSATQYPDWFYCTVNGRRVEDMVDDPEWYVNEFIPQVQQRGAAIIQARGASSAASAAYAAIDHVSTWWNGTPEGDWTSMSIVSDGSYGIPKGLIYSFPVEVRFGKAHIVQGLEVSAFSRERMSLTAQELEAERNTVRELGLID